MSTLYYTVLCHVKNYSTDMLHVQIVHEFTKQIRRNQPENSAEKKQKLVHLVIFSISRRASSHSSYLQVLLNHGFIIIQRARTHMVQTVRQRALNDNAFTVHFSRASKAQAQSKHPFLAVKLKAHRNPPLSAKHWATNYRKTTRQKK